MSNPRLSRLGFFFPAQAGPIMRDKNMERIIWAVLVGVTLVIALMFVRERRDHIPPPPVYGQVPPFSRLTNQLSQAVDSESLRGKVWVADTIFSRCPSLCPVLSKHFRELQSEFAAEKDFHLVSLTADTANDTPEVLLRHGEKYAADAARWWFLTGSRSDVQELGVNGLKFIMQDNAPTNRVDPDDLFLHGPYFVLVDRQARIRGWFDGSLPEKKAELRQAIRAVLKER
jgi:protein SCO1